MRRQHGNLFNIGRFRRFKTLHTRHQHRIIDTGPALETGENIAAIRYLGNPFGRHEAARFDCPKSGGTQTLDQLDLGGGRNKSFLILKSVAGTDFNDAHSGWRCAQWMAVSWRPTS